jgi:protein-S-isoprenylcysteine O-methyltransferase Ste14
MSKAAKQLISFVLPITVLVIVPYLIEQDIYIKDLTAFIAGLLLILCGLSILTVTIYTLSTIGDGTLAPWFPTGKLVVTGLYKHVRNPMIIGVLTVLSGESIALLSYRILIWMFLFFLINHLFFLIYEEPVLEKKFGQEYRDYKQKVPRWIPDLRKLKSQSTK